MSTQHLILGPPGTGKTHRCLELLDQEFEIGIQPDRIAFCSFTKKAASEASGRAQEKFNYDSRDLPFFRTLHSLAFQRLGLRRDEVMQGKHYREIGKHLGLVFSNKSDFEEGLPSSHYTGDRYTFLDGFARARRIPAEEAW